MCDAARGASDLVPGVLSLLVLPQVGKLGGEVDPGWRVAFQGGHLRELVHDERVKVMP